MNLGDASLPSLLPFLLTGVISQGSSSAIEVPEIAEYIPPHARPNQASSWATHKRHELVIPPMSKQAIERASERVNKQVATSTWPGKQHSFVAGQMETVGLCVTLTRPTKPDSAQGSEPFFEHNSNSDSDDGLDADATPYCPQMTWNCGRGHKITGMSQLRNLPCTICTLTGQIRSRQNSPKSVCAEYIAGQCLFEFKCTFGHRLIVSANMPPGCASCRLLAEARRKYGNGIVLDAQSVYVNDQSILRFHCDKLKHSSACENPECVLLRDPTRPRNREYAETCSNFVSCDQDFYATPQMLKTSGHDAMRCSTNHRWYASGTYISLRALEVQFDARFDDIVAGIELTGYNAELKIAFIHAEHQMSLTSRQASIEWCAANSVTLIMIPRITRASHTTTNIITKLVDAGVLKGRVERIVALIRLRVHSMDAFNQLFATRVVIPKKDPAAKELAAPRTNRTRGGDARNMRNATAKNPAANTRQEGPRRSRSVTQQISAAGKARAQNTKRHVDVETDDGADDTVIIVSEIIGDNK